MTRQLADLRPTYPGAVTFKFGAAGAEKPVVGRKDIVLAWDGTPTLVIETLEVSIKTFGGMDAGFALAEGEDETLEGWQKSHRAYFERNGGWSLDMDLICERFRVVKDLAPVRI